MMDMKMVLFDVRKSPMSFMYLDWQQEPIFLLRLYVHCNRRYAKQGRCCSQPFVLCLRYIFVDTRIQTPHVWPQNIHSSSELHLYSVNDQQHSSWDPLTRHNDSVLNKQHSFRHHYNIG